jgi:hypothetical protein
LTADGAAPAPAPAAVLSMDPAERELGMVQEQHIVAVYSDGGDKMLAALYENPVDAVPVVATRLEAKGAEWRKARPSACLLVLASSFDVAVLRCCAYQPAAHRVCALARAASSLQHALTAAARQMRLNVPFGALLA